MTPLCMQGHLIECMTYHPVVRHIASVMTLSNYKEIIRHKEGPNRTIGRILYLAGIK